MSTRTSSPSRNVAMWTGSGESPLSSGPGDPDIEESVFRKGSDVFFRADVDEESISRLILLSEEVLKDGRPSSKSKYRLHLHSDGGSVVDLFSFVDFLEYEVFPNTEDPTSIVTFAASAASAMAVVFPRRKITRRGTIMIHELSGVVGGKMSLMRHQMKWVKSLQGEIFRLYEERADIDAETLGKIMTEEWWFDAKKALKYGLVDEII